MSDKPWKVFERKIAAIFGTSRALMKGTSEIKDIGPEDDFPLLLDCKLWKKERWTVTSWMKKLEDAVIDSGHYRWPVVCVKEPGKVRKYAVVRQKPLFKFIIEKPVLIGDVFFYCDGGRQRGTPILLKWDLMFKELKKIKRYVSPSRIPILTLYNTMSNMDLAILTPEDLARIFYAGGVLKKIGIEPL